MIAANASLPAVVVLVSLLGGAGVASAQDVVPPVSSAADESFVPETTARCGTGILQVLGPEGPIEQEFPLKHTSVEATVSGVMSRVEVTQTFANPYDETIEAVYVFPLPHEAAVTDLQMTLGERVILGLIERREEARRIYEQARRDGHAAALLEQERANIFTQSVANILPGNEIEIRITYVEQIEPERGTWEFAFPMVVGPRYMPQGGADDVVPVAVGSKPRPPEDDMPSPPGSCVLPPRAAGVGTGDGVNPPFLPPAIRSGHDIDLVLTLEAGVRLANLRSPTHAFVRETDAAGNVRVRLHPADTIPNKDFVLRWEVEGNEPEIALLTHHDGTQGWVSVIVHPKSALKADDITPKEMVFVLDCSGSMRGEPMAAAKALARRALLDMGPEDSFQIIRFSTNASGFSPAPVAATPANVRRGLAYLEQLHGSGGTEMIQGIRAALDYPPDAKRLRIVMFLTDGYIGNENQILAAVRDRIGQARLFSFGVGSSVNRFLLEEMAREGRGHVAYQLPGSRADELVETFYRRIRHPYLTDVEVAWQGVEVLDANPARIPDLFEGGVLVLRGRYERGGRGELRVRGRIAGRAWERRFGIDLPRAESGNPAIGSLWARGRIADLERSMHHGRNATTVEEITQLALAHRLVTSYTSFVAVEEQMVVSDGQPTRVRVPVDLPQGVSHEGVFGTKGEAAMQKATIQGLHVRGGRSAKVGFRIDGLSSRDVPAGPSAAVPPQWPREVLRDERKFNGEDEDVQGLTIQMIATTSTVRPDGSIRLRIVFTNRGSQPVLVPGSPVAVEELGLTVIGATWQEESVEVVGGATRAEIRTVRLAPGAVHVCEVEIPVSSLRSVGQGAMVHLLLDGRRWGSTDRPRVSVRILAG